MKEVQFSLKIYKDTFMNRTTRFLHLILKHLSTKIFIDNHSLSDFCHYRRRLGGQRSARRADSATPAVTPAAAASGHGSLPFSLQCLAS